MFTLEELADLYDEGTGWCTDLAVEVAPDEPFAWDARVVADAAFGALPARGDRLRGRAPNLGVGGGGVGVWGGVGGGGGGREFGGFIRSMQHDRFGVLVIGGWMGLGRGRIRG